METGHARDMDGNIFECATFVIVLEPRKLIDVCYLKPMVISSEVDNNNEGNAVTNNNKYNLYSDIQDIPTLQYKSPLLNNLYNNTRNILKNITEKVQKYKHLALEKVEYINNYKNDL